LTSPNFEIKPQLPYCWRAIYLLSQPVGWY